MKRVLIILSFTLLTATYMQAQNSRSAIATRDAVKINAYPNPATSYIIFEVQGAISKGMKIEVYHMLGRKLFESKNIQEKTNLNLSDFNRGLYIYHLLDATGKLIESGKFQVSK